MGRKWVKRDPSKIILAIADAIREGRNPPDPLILVGATNASVSELVLIEGYKRATAYAFVGGDREISALVGSTDRLREWTPAAQTGYR